jgi:hypothetical protein
VLVRVKPGLRLRSQVCSTEVIIVRGSADVDLTCGGKPMVSVAEAAEPGSAPAPGLDAGSELGKRYTVEGSAALEVLCTKPGQGSLAIADTPLVLKDAKPLPSSD